MNATTARVGERQAASRLETLSLVVLGFMAVKAALAFPAQGPGLVSLPKDDLVLRFQAHQLFQRDPEELSETQLHDVRRWYRCMQLATRHQTSGRESLNDEERRFVVDTLKEFCPDLEELAGYRRIYDSCRGGLNDGVPAVAATDALHSHSRPVLLE
jgi:hypothetical protein